MDRYNLLGALELFLQDMLPCSELDTADLVELERRFHNQYLMVGVATYKVLLELVADRPHTLAGFEQLTQKPSNRHRLESMLRGRREFLRPRRGGAGAIDEPLSGFSMLAFVERVCEVFPYGKNKEILVFV